MRGDYAKARVSSVFEEWGLKTEPFTFVIDSSGSVSAKFEGFVTTEELSEAIEKALA
jgi:glutathione peroxidase-family protein